MTGETADSLSSHSPPYYSDYLSPTDCVSYTDQKTERQTGRQAQIANIQAAKAVANIIRTTLGPRSMLKMLLDPMGSIVLTNDGHCILREVDVSHPTAKSMIELSRATDEEVGDGTSTCVVLAYCFLATNTGRLSLSPCYYYYYYD